MRLSIRQKLTISYLLIALFVGFLGFVSYYEFKDAAQQSQVITKLEVPNLVHLSEMESYILKGILDAITYPLSNDSEGKIWVESELDQGSTFYVTFPIEASMSDPSLEQVKQPA